MTHALFPPLIVSLLALVAPFFIMQPGMGAGIDAYAGFNRLYAADRKPGPIIEAACWSHARRIFSAKRSAVITRNAATFVRTDDSPDNLGHDVAASANFRDEPR